MALVTSRAVIFPREIDRIMRMPGGPIGVAVRRIALNIAAEAKQIAVAELGNRHPSDAKRTGNYSRRFRVEVATSPAGFEFVVSNNAKYAAVLEQGSKPHEIRARKAKYLRFRSRKTGMMVRVKVVNHPGQKIGYRILERAMLKVARASRI